MDRRLQRRIGSITCPECGWTSEEDVLTALADCYVPHGTTIAYTFSCDECCHEWDEERDDG